MKVLPFLLLFFAVFNSLLLICFSIPGQEPEGPFLSDYVVWFRSTNGKLDGFIFLLCPDVTMPDPESDVFKLLKYYFGDNVSLKKTDKIFEFELVNSKLEDFRNKVNIAYNKKTDPKPVKILNTFVENGVKLFSQTKKSNDFMTMAHFFTSQSNNNITVYTLDLFTLYKSQSSSVDNVNDHLTSYKKIFKTFERVPRSCSHYKTKTNRLFPFSRSTIPSISSEKLDELIENLRKIELQSDFILGYPDDFENSSNITIYLRYRNGKPTSIQDTLKYLKNSLNIVCKAKEVENDGDKAIVKTLTMTTGQFKDFCSFISKAMTESKTLGNEVNQILSQLSDGEVVKSDKWLDFVTVITMYLYAPPGTKEAHHQRFIHVATFLRSDKSKENLALAHAASLLQVLGKQDVYNYQCQDVTNYSKANTAAPVREDRYNELKAFFIKD